MAVEWKRRVMDLQRLTSIQGPLGLHVTRGFGSCRSLVAIMAPLICLATFIIFRTPLRGVCARAKRVLSLERSITSTSRFGRVGVATGARVRPRHSDLPTCGWSTERPRMQITLSTFEGANPIYPLGSYKEALSGGDICIN